MKFLCDNCKAKYQIADEKVAGKTVRMKCRKCGHQIEVRAAVTETSVASSPPRAPSEVPKPGRTGLATSLSQTKPRSQSPSGAHGPGSGALAGAFQRQVEQAPSTQPFPQATGSIEVSVTDEWYVAINGVPVGPVRISELRRKAASGAVNEDSLCWQEGLEEWRPVRSVPELATIVREAAQGNRVSLVTPPPNEGRASSPPRAPTHGPAPVAPPRPGNAPAPPRAPEPRSPAPIRSNVVPLHARLTSDHEPGGTAPLAPPVGGGAAAHGAGAGAGSAALAVAPIARPFSPPQPAPPPRPAAPAADPFALPPAPTPSPAQTQTPMGGGPATMASSASLAPTPSPFVPAEQPKKAGVPLWLWPIVALFVAFGGVAAYAVFIRTPQPPQQIVVQVPVATTPTGPQTNPADVPPPAPDTSAAPTTSASGQKLATGPRPQGGAKPPAGGDKPGGGGAADVSGLLSGGSGPAVGPGGGGGGGGAGGGGLDQQAVQNVVRQRSPGVKRTCWERGGADQKSSANVQVSVTVAPNGQVAGANASGDDPVIAKCIEQQVRGWTFPAPGQTTTVNIPFHFVRQ